MNLLKPGDCFGEYSLIDKAKSSASIVAIEAGELFRLHEDDLDRILNNNLRIAKTFYFNILRILIRRLRKKEDEYDLVLIS